MHQRSQFISWRTERTQTAKLDEELIKINTSNLKEFSNSILLNDNKIVNEKREITNIKTVKKYLLISAMSKLILEKISLFINTLLGLLKERIWLIEYLERE